MRSNDNVEKWFHDQQNKINKELNNFQKFESKCNDPFFQFHESISSIDINLTEIDNNLQDIVKDFKEVSDLSSQCQFTSKVAKTMEKNFTDLIDQPSFIEKGFKKVYSFVHLISNWLFVLFPWSK